MIFKYRNLKNRNICINAHVIKDHKHNIIKIENCENVSFEFYPGTYEKLEMLFIINSKIKFCIYEADIKNVIILYSKVEMIDEVLILAWNNKNTHLSHSSIKCVESEVSGNFPFKKFNKKIFYTYMPIESFIYY